MSQPPASSTMRLMLLLTEEAETGIGNDGTAAGVEMLIVYCMGASPCGSHQLVLLVALIVPLAVACQPSWLKATAAPVMLVLLSGGVQGCSCTDRAARGGRLALLIEGYCCASVINF